MRETTKNSKEVKKGYKESRYTSAGVGIFSLGLVTTLALLFICGYAENRNRDALNPSAANVSLRGMSTWRYRHENKEPLKMNMKDTVTTGRNDDTLVSEGHAQVRTLSVMVGEKTDVAALTVPLANRQRAASVELKSSSEYEMTMTIFILFRLDSVSKLPIVHRYEYSPFPPPPFYS